MITATITSGKELLPCDPHFTHVPSLLVLGAWSGLHSEHKKPFRPAAHMLSSPPGHSFGFRKHFQTER